MPSYLDNLPYAEGEIYIFFFLHVYISTMVLFYIYIGQWSVTNPTGKKVYTKSFLIQLGSEAICQKKPDVLRNWSNLTKLSSGAPQFNSSGVSF